MLPRRPWFRFVQHLKIIVSPGEYSDTQTPSGKTLTFAAVASFGCFALAVMILTFNMDFIEFSNPVQLSVLALPSLVISFFILYCGKILPGLGMAERAFLLLLTAGLIFLCVVFLVGTGFVTTVYISTLLAKNESARGQY